MATQYGGISENVSASLPSAVNIASSTNASPIVITTSAPHGIHTGDAVIVLGHTVNTNANGIRRAGAVTSTTVQLLGATGNGVGGGTGTIQSLAIGATFPIPDDGDAMDAASVGVALEALGDRSAFLYFLLGWAAHVYSGGTFTLDAGSMLKAFGRTAYRAPYRPADAAVITIDTTMGDVVILPNPASSRIVRFDETTSPPVAGERIRLVMPPAMSDGKYFTVQRADGTVIAELHGYTVTESAANVNGNTWIECQREAGLWRGLNASGYIVKGASW